ncbi:MAG: hypothetical protein UU64_C0024G0012 [candidate division WWE3 bacterium GW2011_GWF2_41_45]|uniref:Uncharacterized protein n=1 Tax=candidate division WWE3 bacterium GW2011_GWC2_41_23 TaxID=1619123 RepID=A0A0G0VQP4_UNCKA|nr:MAG: hypothetical protein UU55_C0018G0007 [candidate division WWE3 bacterium GW2011_GWC2_41_23]KKS08604.1 MAG: hypothetical protein UU64_C0024G0012 [candidate division WWE3 bacterium GW2011_GWF2_41_45]HCT30304.1 hypothetical protein [Bacteroidales bacterium]
MLPINKITTPEELLNILEMESLRHRLLRYQEMLDELRYILKDRIEPSLPNISTFMIEQSLSDIDKTGLVFLAKKFNLNNNDIPHVTGLKIDIKSFLFTSRQLIDQQLSIINALSKIVQEDGCKNQLSKDLGTFIPKLHSGLYSIKPQINNYFLSHTFELLYLRFMRNSVKTIGDLKAEMIYTTSNTEINITIKACYQSNDKLLQYLSTDKIELFNFKLIEIFTKTLDLFALYNNLVMDLLVEHAKKIIPEVEIELNGCDYNLSAHSQLNDIQISTD